MPVARKAKAQTQIQAQQTKELLKITDTLTLDSVVADLGNVQVGVQQGLAELTARMTSKLASLRQIEEAIQLKELRLQELHEMEASAITMDEIRNEIARTRLEWQEETEVHARSQKEAREQCNKERAREEEEYRYTIGMNRTREEEQYRQEREDLTRQNALKQVDLERDWREREAKLRAQEEETQQMRARFAQLDAEISKMVQEQTNLQLVSLKRDYETKAQLAAKEAETALRLAKQEAEAAKGANTYIQAQLAELKVQLAKSQEDAKHVATKALESVSGQAALAAVERTANRTDQPAPRR
jgi:hypothetical protein